MCVSLKGIQAPKGAKARIGLLRQDVRQEQGSASTRKGSQFIQSPRYRNMSYERSRSTVECGGNVQVECRVSKGCSNWG